MPAACSGGREASAIDVAKLNGDAAIVIAGVVDRGSVLGQHAFELYGAFPGFSQLRPEVRCGGALVAARVAYASLGQINVFFDERPSNSSCTFALERLTDGVRSGAWGPVAPAPPAIEIAGVNDRGVTAGRHLVELYGRFADGSALEPRVLCDGLSVAARTEYASSGQVNVSWRDTGQSASRCAFVLERWTDRLETPIFGSVTTTRGTLVGFGAYNWGGASLWAGASNTLGLGEQLLVNAGFDTARLVLDPIEISGGVNDWYRLGGAFLAECPPTVPFLPCAVTSTEIRAAVAPSALRTVILTAYDSASRSSSGVTHFNDLQWLEANGAAVYSEYYDAAMRLYETQQGSGKTFVFAEWETDNAIYCGSAYGYVQHLGNPRSPDPCANGAPSPSAAMAGMTKWLTLRHQAVAQAKSDAAALHYTGVSVSDGIEFNSVHLLQDRGLPSTLGEVIPTVRPEFALYSSYDSQNAGKLEEDLRALVLSLGATQLLIGESGFAQHGIDGVDAFRTTESAKAIQRAGLRAAVLWEGFDTSAGPCASSGDPGCVQPFGVLEADGSDRLVSKMVRNALLAQAQAIAARAAARINGINDRGVASDASGAWHYFELYGSFPGGPYSPVVTCDGTDAAGAISGTPSTGQINVRFPAAPTGTGYCVFRLVRADGETTLDFGPKLVGP
jgi:hypothetical protein